MKLESAQRRWTKEVDELSEKPYETVLRTLGLYLIYGRLIRYDLIKAWTWTLLWEAVSCMHKKFMDSSYLGQFIERIWNTVFLMLEELSSGMVSQ